MSTVKFLPVSDPRSFGPMERFCNCVTELGGIILEDRWLGTNKPHKVLCSEGHIRYPSPTNVLSGKGICKSCVNSQTRLTNGYYKYIQRLYDLGAQFLTDEWLGMLIPHKVKCKAGHIVSPIPSAVMSGQGPCNICAGINTLVSRDKFLRIVLNHQAIMIGSWQGSHNPVKIRCRHGHVSTPRPHQVLCGQGFCHYCAGKVWDVIYVVSNPMNGACKFGITSGNPRPRLAKHFADGYWNQERVYTDVSNALDIERLIKSELRTKGFTSIRGTEYFGNECLPLILGIVDQNIRKD